MVTRLLIATVLIATLIVLIASVRWLMAWYDRRTLRRLQQAGPSRSSAAGEGAEAAHPASADGGARILYFTTETCVVCRAQQEPAIASLLEHRPDIRLDRVDAIEQRALADEFKVRSVPTTAVYNAAGALVSVNRGFTPAAILLAQIEDRDIAVEGGVLTAAEPLKQ